MTLTLTTPVHTLQFRADKNEPVEVVETTALACRIRNDRGELGWVARSFLFTESTLKNKDKDLQTKCKKEAT